MSWRSLSDSLLRSSCTRGVFAIKKRSQYKVNRVPKVWHGGVFVSFQPYPWVQVEHQHGIRRALEARPFSLSGAPGAPVKIAAGITIRRHPSAHPAHPQHTPRTHISTPRTPTHQHTRYGATHQHTPRTHQHTHQHTPRTHRTLLATAQTQHVSYLQHTTMEREARNISIVCGGKKKWPKHHACSGHTACAQGSATGPV